MGNFFLGLGIGLIGGVMFAPKPGAETRDYLRRTADEGTGYVKDRASELGTAASDMVEKSKQTVKGQAAKLADQGAEYLKDRANEMGAAANDMVEKGKQAVTSQASKMQHDMHAAERS